MGKGYSIDTNQALEDITIDAVEVGSSFLGAIRPRGLGELRPLLWPFHVDAPTLFEWDDRSYRIIG